jgi:alkylated DNA repair protein alkB family protein 1
VFFLYDTGLTATGLRILPSLLPPECQVLMLNSLLHRDLSNPLHKTNLHPDYSIPYPSPSSPSNPTPSFFAYHPSSRENTLLPLNPHSNHKPLNPTQFLSKKLRWLTLGSQYDWTTRSYPTTSPTPFPSDIASLVRTLFRSSFEPESGVVLLYSPKDYMPVHRDVSELCERGLASFTLGCDGLFILSKEKEAKEGGITVEADELDEDREMEMCVLRVRSGDCVWMGGETRWCWHAMPKVMGGTCPEWLESWPVVESGDIGDANKMYEKWRGFMRGKRLNISCRQVWG